MLYVVTGGSGSGKSQYAEEKICKLCREAGGGMKIYVATMMPYGKETKEKIARHRRMRAEKDFLTRECYMDLSTFVRDMILPLPEKPWILLECLSNLTANEMFDEKGAGKETEERVKEGIRLLTEACRDVVIVTNEVCSEAALPSSSMEEYKRTLSEINRFVFGQAETAEEIVYGIPCTWKKDDNSGKAEIPTQRKKGGRMKLIIGGAYQGKLSYAKRKYPDLTWADGAVCGEEEIIQAQGVYHLETFIKRQMQEEKEADVKEKILSLTEKNPDLVIVSDEIGYGLVPVDAFERVYRENVGRICTELAAKAESVERVVCGIGMMLKEVSTDENRT